MGRAHAEGTAFRWLLSYHENKAEREAQLRQVTSQVSAVTLRQDAVVPPSEVLNTLQGEMRDIPIDVRVLDFPFKYSHVVPFPPSAPEPELSQAFDNVFAHAANHLG